MFQHIRFAKIRTLNDLDNFLIQTDCRDINIINQAHQKIFYNMPNITFKYLEQRYRALVSNIYLIAAPTFNLPSNISALDHRTKKPTKYFIWICVNGEHEAIQQMNKFKISDFNQNLDRLTDCGILYKTTR